MKRRTIAILFSLVALAPASARGSCSSDGLSLRGDVDCNGHITITDPIALVDHLFSGGDPPSCPDAADANDDGRLTVSDVVEVLTYLFVGRESIPTGEWARDPTPDSLGCETGRPPCPRPVVPHRVGAVHCEGCLDQPSGMVVSRKLSDTLWVVSDYDDGQDPTIYALSSGGDVRSVVHLCASRVLCPPVGTSGCWPDVGVHCDWEGLAYDIGPDGEGTLYVGDLGGNRTSFRRIFWIHRVREPESLGQAVTLLRDRGDFDTLYFSFPGSKSDRYDAEVLLCDPVSHDILVATEAPVRALFRYPHPQRPGEVVVLEPIAEIPSVRTDRILSGGDISPAGTRLILKLDRWVHIFPWNRGDPAASFASEERCDIDLGEFLGAVQFHAGAVAFTSEDSFLSLEESPIAAIFRIDLGTEPSDSEP